MCKKRAEEFRKEKVEEREAKTTRMRKKLQIRKPIEICFQIYAMLGPERHTKAPRTKFIRKS